MSTPFRVSAGANLTIQIPKSNEKTTEGKKITPEKGTITQVFENSIMTKKPTANLPIPLKQKTKNWEEEDSPGDSPSSKNSKETTDRVGRGQLNSPSGQENEKTKEVDSPHWDAELQFTFEEDLDSAQPAPEKYIN